MIARRHDLTTRVFVAALVAAIAFAPGRTSPTSPGDTRDLAARILASTFQHSDVHAVKGAAAEGKRESRAASAVPGTLIGAAPVSPLPALLLWILLLPSVALVAIRRRPALGRAPPALVS